MKKITIFILLMVFAIKSYSWEKEYIKYGVVKLDGNRKVRIYKTPSKYLIITNSDDILDVRWGGDAVIVYLKNKKVLRYTTESKFTYIN